MKHLLLCCILLVSVLYADSPVKNLRKNPDDPFTLFQAAFYFLNTENNLSFASSLLEKALRIDPDFSAAAALLGDIDMLRLNHPSALNHYIQITKNSPETLYGLDIIYPEIDMNISRDKKALYYIKTLLESDDPVIQWNAAANLGYSWLGKDSKKARSYFSKLAVIRNWMIVGPFDNKDNVGFQTAYEPETEVNLSAEYRGKIAQIGWWMLPDTTYDGIISIANNVYPEKYTVNYLYTAVYSANQKNAVLRIGANDSVKAWVNSELILEGKDGEEFFPDQFCAPIVLAKGWNSLLLKICSKDNASHILPRITGEKGEILDTLVYKADFTGFSPSAIHAEHKAMLPVIEKTPALKKLSPGYARYLCARRLSQLSFHKSAVQIYEHLLKSYPDSSLIQTAYADSLMTLSNVTSAVSALQKAVKCKENLAAAFKLGKYYYSSRMFDRALEMFRTIYTKRPEFSDASLYLSRALAQKNFSDESLQIINTGFKTFYDNADFLYNAALYYLVEGNLKKALKAVERSLQISPYKSSAWSTLHYLVKTQANIGKLTAEYRNALKIFPDNLAYRMEAAQALKVYEHFDDAAQFCREIIELCPQHYAPYEILGNMAFLKNDTKQAKTYWEKALQCEPDNAPLRERFSYHFPGKPTLTKKFATPSDEIEIIIKNAPHAGKYPKTTAVVLLNERISQVFDAGSSQDYVHKIVKIFNAQDDQVWQKIFIPGNARNFNIISAYTLKADGTKTEATDISRSQVTMPQLEDNCIVDICYTAEFLSNSWLENEFAANSYFHYINPTLLQRYVVIIPESKPLITHVYDPSHCINSKKSLFDGNIVYEWTARDLKQIHKEPLSPSYYDLASSVHVTTIKSWQALAEWFLSLIQDQFRTNSDIEETVKKLTSGCDTDTEKIRAIYRFVTTKIRYVNNDRGIFGKKPDPCINIFANKYGDCKDKTTLMIAMLKLVNIKAYYAAVRTNDQGQIFKETPFCQTNHIITCIPMKDGSYWFLDPTAQNLSSDSLPSVCQGIDALVLEKDENSYEFIKTPVLPPENSYAFTEAALTIDKNGNLSAESSETYRGNEAAMLRFMFSNEGKQQETIEQILNMLIRGAQVSSHSIENLTDSEKPPVIHYTFNAPDFARKVGDTMYIKPIVAQKFSSQYCPREQRYYNIVLPKLFKTASKDTYIIPAGFRIKSIPENFSESNRFFSYTIEVKHSGNSITITRTITFNSLIVPLSDYASFRESCLRCDYENEKEIILERVQ